MLSQCRQRNDVQRLLVCGLQCDLRGATCAISLQPAASTQTPAIPGDEPWKSPHRGRGRKIIAARRAERQKFVRHDGAHRVRTCILRPGFATARPRKSGQRIMTAIFDGSTENIEAAIRHGDALKRDRCIVFLSVGGGLNVIMPGRIRCTALVTMAYCTGGKGAF